LVEIIIAKQRNGPTGEVSLMYVKQFMRFENFAVEHSGFAAGGI
jgi:replicative DNA helicase